MRLPGERFGHITVIRLTERCAKSHAFYEVACDCGNIAIKKDTHLNSKAKYCSRTCPLLLQRYKDLTGEKFGRWTVLRRDTPRKGKGRYWLCRCECGTTGSVPAAALFGSLSNSCGCFRYIAKRKYFTDEESKEGNRARRRRYRDKNPAKAKFYQIKYGLKLGYATPLWLKEDHWRDMDRFYRKARRLTAKTKVVHHVDHIVPLQGKTVCGLHVPWNLQVLTASENISKSNKLYLAA